MNICKENMPKRKVKNLNEIQKDPINLNLK